MRNDCEGEMEVGRFEEGRGRLAEGVGSLRLEEAGLLCSSLVTIST